MFRSQLLAEFPAARKFRESDQNRRSDRVVPNVSLANSLTEVVQRASAVYDFLQTEMQKGNQLVVKGPDGDEKEVVLLRPRALRVPFDSVFA